MTKLLALNKFLLKCQGCRSTPISICSQMTIVSLLIDDSKPNLYLKLIKLKNNYRLMQFLFRVGRFLNLKAVLSLLKYPGSHNYDVGAKQARIIDYWLTKNRKMMREVSYYDMFVGMSQSCARLICIFTYILLLSISLLKMK